MAKEIELKLIREYLTKKFWFPLVLVISFYAIVVRQIWRFYNINEEYEQYYNECSHY